jgi:large subunit ribosomal protein L1
LYGEAIMSKKGKNIVNASAKVDKEKKYSLDEAVDLVLNAKFGKFDESVDVAVRLGVDPRQADQMVRGSVVLPHGTGKKIRIIAFAQGEKEKEAKEAGAELVGAEELVEKIKGGWLDFDKAVATPDMMRVVGKVAKILGPRGMMPNPKTGTVTNDIAAAIKDIQAGKVDFRVEKAGIVHSMVGKVSFGAEKIKENLLTFFEKIIKMKPASSKGTYLKSVSISTTQGTGVKIDGTQLTK